MVQEYVIDIYHRNKKLFENLFQSSSISYNTTLKEIEEFKLNEVEAYTLNNEKILEIKRVKKRYKVFSFLNIFPVPVSKNKCIFIFLEKPLISFTGEPVQKEFEPVFNTYTFQQQFFQHIFLLDTLIPQLYKEKKGKLIILDLCTGAGSYALYIAKKYGKFVDRVYATEINPRAIGYLRFNIDFNELVEKIVVAPVENWSSKNPFESKQLEKSKKFDLIVTNPPYVPVPPHKNYYRWGDGGEYGIETISNIFLEAKDYLTNGGKLLMISYTLGQCSLEKGSLLTGSIKLPSNETESLLQLEKINQYLEYSKNTFYYCYPPAWIGFQRKLGESNPIPYERYYSVVFENNYRTDYFNKLHNLRINYLHNILLESEPSNLSYTVVIKGLSPEYLKDIYELEKKCWPDALRASERNLYLRLKFFPEGCFGAFTLDGKLAGFSTSQRINFKIEDIPGKIEKKLPIINSKKWMEIDTERDGDIRNTHVQEGNTLHFVSSCTLPGYTGCGIWSALIKRRIMLAKQLNLEYIVVASRLSDYNQTIDIHKYLEKSRDKYLNFFKTFDFVPICIIRIDKNENMDKFWVLLVKNLREDES